MIEITYNRQKFKVTVMGHAQSGEVGHDLVCAATSMLVYTLAANITNLAQCTHKMYRRPVINLDDGSAELSLHPIRKGLPIAQIVFDSICAGFELLSKNYPDKVKYTLVVG